MHRDKLHGGLVDLMALYNLVKEGEYKNPYSLSEQIKASIEKTYRQLRRSLAYRNPQKLAKESMCL